jgi:hypothetical protein
MSALGGKADVNGELPQRPLLTQIRHLYCIAPKESAGRGGLLPARDLANEWPAMLTIVPELVSILFLLQ